MIVFCFAGNVNASIPYAFTTYSYCKNEMYGPY